MNVDAQQYLIDNGFDDLILNDRRQTKINDRKYTSDVLTDYAKLYHTNKLREIEISKILK
jgi:hypothetical protein